MAEKIFPQIPGTVWWGMRQLLQKSPKAKYDENMLSAALSVQPAAARQYFAELKRVGILDDDGRGTELANKWRMDESYASAVEELAIAVYPESLVTIAPPGDADRQRVVNWFMNQGLGEGSAKNKAATYLLVTSLEPNAAVSGAARPDSSRSNGDRKPRSPAPARQTSPSERKTKDGGQASPSTPEIMPLNVNVQIHISADASKDQIENIFAAMRKYLRND